MLSRAMIARCSLLALVLAGAAAGCADEEPRPSSTSLKKDEPTGPCGEGLDTTPKPVPKIHTPRWAFEPWISKDISSTDDTYDFVAGFEQRNIPVGVVVLDSPWETNYHTFVPNPVRYHNFEKLVSDLKAKGIRLIVWMTPNINYSSFDLEIGGDFYEGSSPNYEEAQSCGFFVNEGNDYFWWKGKGAGLDFFNPKAVAWWHYQQRSLLDMGVAGFKLDFGENYMGGKPFSTAAGTVSLQEYSEAYYRDFYAHGVAYKGAEEFTTMVRPYDKSYDFEGRFFARKEHAPVAWVGDNRRDWFGLADALDHLFISAKAGYVVIGSDIGGYLDRDDADLTKVIPESPETFLRWTALGGLTPFMQLHGRANLTPWTVSEYADEAVAGWKYWGTLHRELVPFFYSLAEESYAGGALPILRPIGEPETWPGDYRFHLGDAFLAAPMLESGTSRDVALPEGTRYVNFWKQADAPLEGFQQSVDASDLTKIPLFLREGAIVPLDVADDTTGLGDKWSAGTQTLLVYPGRTASRFVIHDEDDATTEVDVSSDAQGATITLSRATKPFLLRVRAEAGASSVSADGAALTAAASPEALSQAGKGFRVDAASRVVWVRVPASSGAQSIKLVWLATARRGAMKWRRSYGLWGDYGAP